MSQTEPKRKLGDLYGGWKSRVKKGWCVYTSECYDTLNLRAIRRSRPDMIRWIVEWDRMDVVKDGQSLRKKHIDRCIPFFKVCAEQGITVVVQLWVKDRLWGGDGNGGTQWAKPSKMANYPANIDQSYGSFVRDLVKAMNDAGIKDENIIMEAWNDPDLLLESNSAQSNYAEPWEIMKKKGFNKWTGGSGEKWNELHQVLNKTNPNIPWASCGIGVNEISRPWILPCYRTNKISIIDLHYDLWNFKTPKEYCDSVSKIIDRWDEEIPPPGREPMPFFIGECARVSGGKSENLAVKTQDAAMMREICRLLHEKYGMRFLGMTAHGPISMWKEAAWFEEQYSNQ
ncbi:MAG: hypothetical protein N3F09_03620 [Bacteroidia bacterium]|nr:hypothetical protein [Bacteroidia bacterium]